jgi:hypothetical protein
MDMLWYDSFHKYINDVILIVGERILFPVLFQESDVLMYYIMFTWKWLHAAETCCEEASIMYTRRKLVARKE